MYICMKCVLVCFYPKVILEKRCDLLLIRSNIMSDYVPETDLDFVQMLFRRTL